MSINENTNTDGVTKPIAGKKTHMNQRTFATFGLPLGTTILFSLAVGGCVDDVKNPVVEPVPIACADLVGMTIPAASIGLPTSGAVVDSAEVVVAAGMGPAALGEYCKVVGSIKPIDPNANDIQFQIHMPTEWNSKVMNFGGGGVNGRLSTFLNVVQASRTDQLTPQGRGYAVVSNDSGHTATTVIGYGPDASFGLNDEMLKNFTGDALKKTHDAAQVVIGAHYASSIKKTYFSGGSTGGREALQVTQRWPQDYDGVICLFPAWNSAVMTMQFGRITKTLSAPGGYFNNAKRQLIKDAAVAACDGLDGVDDGIISNVAACNASFKPATATVDATPGGTALRCVAGADTGDTCLSDAQLATLDAFNTPLMLSYKLASGETHYPGFNVWGADLGITTPKPELASNMFISLNILQPQNPMVTGMPFLSMYWNQWVKYFVTADPDYDAFTLDPENAGEWEARISALSLLQDINNTDLSAFHARGGKLLMAHGSIDIVVSARATAEYYDRLTTTMGADKVASFVRYYEIPGYGHSVSSTFNAGWDSVTALEDWVEKGAAPVHQVVVDKSGVLDRTRPMCEYPSWPKYNGSGDVNLEASFQCVIE